MPANRYRSLARLVYAFQRIQSTVCVSLRQCPCTSPYLTMCAPCSYGICIIYICILCFTVSLFHHILFGFFSFYLSLSLTLSGSFWLSLALSGWLKWHSSRPLVFFLPPSIRLRTKSSMNEDRMAQLITLIWPKARNIRNSFKLV